MPESNDVSAIALNPEHLDVVRDALCAVSGSPSGTISRPAHVNRISHLTRTILDEQRAGIFLERLRLLSECFRLAQGYWLPAPIRFVNAHGILLILAPHSTRELSRTLSAHVTTAGDARTCDVAPPGIPEQTLVSWIGAPMDTALWTKSFLERARNRLVRTSLDSDVVDVHAAPRDSASTLLRAPGRWLRVSEADDFSGVSLCRTRLDGPSFRYFLAHVSAGTVTHEAEIDGKLRARIRYGLDLLAHRHHRIQLLQHSDSYTFELYRPLPTEELRLVHAVSLSVSHGARLHVRVQSQFMDCIQRTLRPLGILFEPTA
jgi:hypothetical protein